MSKYSSQSSRSTKDVENGVKSINLGAEKPFKFKNQLPDKANFDWQKDTSRSSASSGRSGNDNNSHRQPNKQSTLTTEMNIVENNVKSAVVTLPAIDSKLINKPTKSALRFDTAVAVGKDNREAKVLHFTNQH